MLSQARFGLYIANRTRGLSDNRFILGCRCNYGYHPRKRPHHLCSDILKFKIQGDRNSGTNTTVIPVEAPSRRETFNKILKTAIPVAMGSLIMSVGSLIDQGIVQRVLLNMIENLIRRLFRHSTVSILQPICSMPTQRQYTPAFGVATQPLSLFFKLVSSRNTGVRFRCLCRM